MIADNRLADEAIEAGLRAIHEENAAATFTIDPTSDYRVIWSFGRSAESIVCGDADNMAGAVWKVLQLLEDDG